MTEQNIDTIQELEAIDLDVLINNDIDQIDSDLLSWMYKCAIFRLTEKGHNSICSTKVFFSDELDDYNNYGFHWTGFIPPNKASSFQDENVTTDNAAMGIAILLVLRLTKYKQFERSAADGGGFDFYLLESDNFFDNSDNDIKCRLEVSGIKRETKTNSFEGRIQGKKNQTKKSDYLQLDAYVCVTEFSYPKTSLIFRNYNS